MRIKSVRIKLNSQGAREILSSGSVSDDLTSRAQSIAAAAGPGMEVTTTRNRDRAVVFVKTATTEARRAEAEDRALTRAIDAGR